MCSIGKRIAKLRQQNNISQEKLADILSTGRSTVIRYETGKTLPNCDVIIKLCCFFHVSADYLLGLTDSDSSLSTIDADYKQPNKPNCSTVNNSSQLPSIQEDIRKYIDHAVEEAIKQYLNT